MNRKSTKSKFLFYRVFSIVQLLLPGKIQESQRILFLMKIMFFQLYQWMEMLQKPFVFKGKILRQ